MKKLASKVKEICTIKEVLQKFIEFFYLGTLIHGGKVE